MLNKLLTLKGKHIFAIYTKMYETVAEMVLKYYDNDQFDRTVFVVNALVDEDSNDVDFRQYCVDGNRYIYYQLNDLVTHPEYAALEHMIQFDEIWDVSLVNMECYDESIRDRVTFMPIRYMDIPKIPPKGEYKYDICVLGVLNSHANNIIYGNTKWWDTDYCTLKIISGYPYTDCLDELGDCKYVFLILPNNGYIPIDYTTLANVISSGKQAITMDNGENILHPFVKRAHSYYDVVQLTKDEPVDNSKAFEVWSGNDTAYEQWRQYWLGDNYKPRLNV